MSLRQYHHRIFFLITLTTGLTAAQAQESGKDSLKTAFYRYQSEAPQEKLFVHIDRAFYIAGETIWFRLYDIDGYSNRPQALSGIAYIEVLDRDQRPILQTKVEMKNGSGDGALSIPLSISSGKFLFRAYTSWMKNFSPDFYYMQPLTILNTLNDPGADSAGPSHPPDSLHFQSATMPAPADTPTAGIRLFPEGGNLVNGLTSVIAVETADHQGKGVPCDGAIIDKNKDTLARFHTALSGIGRFSFTPAAGDTYYVITEIDHAIVTRPLPARYDQGYVMHVDETSNTGATAGNRIHISVHAAGPVASPAVYLLVHTHGQLKAIQLNFLANGQTNFYLDKDSLGDGVSHLTVFNSDRMPVCERLYFKQPKQQLHIGIATTSSTDPSSATVTPLSSVAVNASPTFPTRSRITVDLSATGNSGNPLTADLSMSVFRLDSLQSIPSGNILAWLLLGSDLKGTIDLPQEQDWASNPITAQSLDDLMLTRGWSRFRWEDILTSRKPAFEFLPETNGPVINAKVIDKRTGQPPAPVIAYLSVPGQHFKLATALSRPDGYLSFHLDNFYGNRTLIAQTNSMTDSNCRIEVSSAWSDRFAPFPLPSFTFSTKWSDQLLMRTIEAQAENAYLTARKHRLTASAEDTTVFFGTADLKYNLDDYTRFVTMEEVVQEFVDNVRIRRKSGHAYVRVKNVLFNLFFDDDPLLLIDGIPVFNQDKLVATDPGKIKTIDVVSHKYILGPSITDGVVSFRSYDGEFAGYELDPNALAIQYNGLDRHREFYTPVYNSIEKGLPSIPDFRNELLWAPSIPVNAAGRQSLPLYTSDLTGKFAVVVQGITPDGLAGYSIEIFSVSQ
ncbi:MAG TPA: hypothetical protein VFE32_23115 [Puia sp.]|jgi:hypothetical protein|nr:hypothetical protein [Puia sp.]